MSANTPAQRVDRVLSEAVGRDLSSWERHEFLPSIRQRATLTEKQEAVLSRIESRVLSFDGLTMDDSVNFEHKLYAEWLLGQRATLTEKQEAVLSRIESRVFGDDES